MTDLATLGIRVEGQEVVRTDAQLDSLAASAGKAETATDRLAAAARGNGAAMMTMNTAVRQQSVVLGSARAGMGLTAAEGLNLSRQFADIGVTAAMGMNPLMIALQQGPQLLDIFQMAAARTGGTVTSVMRSIGAAAWAAVGPFAPLIAAIGAVAAVAGGVLALTVRQANKEFGDLTTGMGLTEKQLEKLKETGTNTGVTLGDVFRGAGTTIKEVFFDMFGPQIEAVQAMWDDWMNRLWQGTTTAVRAIAGSFTGAFFVIRDTWKLLPAALGDAVFSTASAVLAGIETMINGGIQRINVMMGRLVTLGATNPAFRMFTGLTQIQGVSMGGVGNQFAGGMAAAGQAGGASWARGFAAGVSGIDGLGDRFMANVGASARARIRGAAGDAETGSDRNGRDRAGRPEEVDLVKATVRAVNPIDVHVPKITTHVEALAAELRLVDQLTQDMARGLASAFGEPGRALGDLMTTMSGYQSRLTEITVAQQQKRLTEAQADRERAQAQMQNYGDMAAAAKGFFEEGSTGYRVMLAIEQAYRVQQMIGMVQAMVLGQQETAATVANSTVRSTALAGEGAANMFAQLGPWAFPAVAAMIALLAGMGVKSSGGGRTAPSMAANDNSPSGTTDAVRSQGAREQASRSANAQALAQSVFVAVEFDDPMFRARVTKEAAPMATAAYRGAVGTSREAIPAEQTQKANMTLRSGRR